MNSRILLNLTLALVLAGLVTFAIYEPGKEKNAPEVTLTSIKPSDIQSIVIEQAQRSKIVLQKTNGEWHMQQPLNVAANKPLIETLLKIADTKSHSSYAVSEVDLDQLHLGSPSLVLYLNDKKLAFGDTDALRGYRYVLTDNRVYLITDRFSHLIRNDFTSLVSPSLLPGNINITKLVLPDLIVQEGSDGWITKPEQKVNSADQVQKLVDEWHYAQAMKITRLTDSNKQDTSKKLGVAEIYSSQNNPYFFTIYSSDDEIILVRPDPGLRYHFEKQAGQRLLSLAADKNKPDNPN